MSASIKSFLLHKLLRDLQNEPFVCIVQPRDGGPPRVYVKEMEELPSEIEATLHRIQKGSLNGTEN